MTNTNKQFNNLKKWLKNNNIYFEKGYSNYDEQTQKHNFVEIPSAFARVYNDYGELSLDSSCKYVTYQNNKMLYKAIKEEIKKGGN